MEVFYAHDGRMLLNTNQGRPKGGARIQVPYQFKYVYRQLSNGSMTTGFCVQFDCSYVQPTPRGQTQCALT